MSKTNLLPLAALSLLATPAFAQLLQPVTQLRAAPRASWTLLTVTGAPTQRRDNPGAASNDRLYMFGGRDGNANSTVHNALYAFDGTAWTLMTPDTTTPGFPVARGGACVAWDFTHNKLIVFGGDTGTGPVGGPATTATLLGDTWEWDPTTNLWTDITATAGGPSPRRFASMTQDPVTGGILLFGGETNISPVAPSAETWLLLNGTWVQMTPLTSPAARSQHSLMTRTAPFADIVLCAGLDESFLTTTDKIRFLDVWRWDGSNWSKISDWDFVNQVGSHPATANAAQAVYDPLRHRIVLQGGQGLSAGTFTSSAATGTPTNTALLYGYFNSGTGQWEQYNGSPSNWTSEFDSFTNTWTIYSRKLAAPALATFGENDPVIGRTSRFFAGFVPSLGKIIKSGGQNSSGTGSTFGTCSYQATPVASSTSYGTGCTGPGGPLVQTVDAQAWTGRTVQTTTTGFGPLSVGYAMASVTQVFPGIPVSAIPGLPGPGLGCELLIGSLDVTGFLFPSGGAATWTMPLPDASLIPTLIGVTFYVQVAELDFSAGWIGTYASNGVACTIGAL